MIKKVVFSVLLTSVLLCTCLTVKAATQGVITGETVKLREQGNLQAKLVMLLSVNDKVEVLNKEEDWYQVQFEGKTGYVYQDYIKVDGIVEEQKQPNKEDSMTTENTEEKSGESEQNESNVTVETIVTQDAFLKLIPLLQVSDNEKIAKDTKVTIQEERNGWCYIQTETVSGWIRKEKLQEKEIQNTEPEVKKPEQPKQEEKKQEEKKTKVGYVNVDTVNVRKQPDTSSNVVTNLSKNDKVTIESEENNWSKITTSKGTSGYIASKYLSEKQVEVTNRSGEVDRTKNEQNTSNNVEPVSNSNGRVGEQIVSYAKQFLGTRYISGGKTPNGFDCSGFTSYVYKHFGYTLSGNSAGQAQNGVKVEKANLQLGDLVLFSQGSKAIGHVGIYIGANQFIHASNPSDGVKITSLSNSYYVQRYVTARRIL